MFNDEFETPEKTNLTNFDLQIGDRVAVCVEGKATKARVCGLVADVAVDVTIEKDGPVISYPRQNVMPLYRHVKTPMGEITTVLVFLQNG